MKILSPLLLCSLLMTLLSSCSQDDELLQPTSSSGQAVNSEWERFEGPSPSFYVSELLEINSHLFARCRDGYYKSSDMGETWEEITTMTQFDDGPNYGWSWRRLSSWGDTLYVTITDGTTISYEKSADLGVSWQEAFNGLTIPSVFGVPPIAGTPIFIDGKIFVSAPANIGGMYRSDDYGTTWVGVDVERLTSIASVGGTYIAPILGGFAISNDGGSTFEINYLEDLGLQSSAPQKVAVYQNVAFCGLFAPGELNVIKSSDAGTSWTACGMDALTLGAGEAIAESSRVLIPANNKVYFSTNFGESWEQFGGDLPDISGTFAVNSKFIKGSTHYFVTISNGPVYRKLID